MIIQIRSRRRATGLYVGLAIAVTWLIWTLVAQDPATHGFWETGIASPLILGPVLALAFPIGARISARNLDPAAYAAEHPVAADRYVLLQQEEFLTLKAQGYLIERPLI